MSICSVLHLSSQEDTPCPEVCRKDKYPVTDGHLVPANNQSIALNKASKYAILPAKRERTVVTHVLLQNEHVASGQRP